MPAAFLFFTENISLCDMETGHTNKNRGENSCLHPAFYRRGKKPHFSAFFSVSAPCALSTEAFRAASGILNSMALIVIV